MPLTPFQRDLLRRLADNRSPESYVAGGIALNAREALRWSADVDVFHDAEEAVIRASDRDVATLEHDGYGVSKSLWTPTFRRAWVSKMDEGVRLEWAQDSAWRFFPIVRDEVLGWSLHWFDALTNKALAMGSRSETRDLVDIVHYAYRCPLHSVIWAACSKDPGFGPLLLLDQMRRHSRVDVADLRAMGIALEPQDLKVRWLTSADRAGQELERAGASGVEVGLAFVDPLGQIGWFDDTTCTPHRAQLGGAFPRVIDNA